MLKLTLFGLLENVAILWANRHLRLHPGKQRIFWKDFDDSSIEFYVETLPSQGKSGSNAYICRLFSKYTYVCVNSGHTHLPTP